MSTGWAIIIRVCTNTPHPLALTPHFGPVTLLSIYRSGRLLTWSLDEDTNSG